MQVPRIKKKIVFIINPISGLGKQKFAEDKINTFLDHDKYEASIDYTECPGHATELTTKAVAGGADIVVAVGGDGTVNEVGQALVNTKTAMGILPAGSGNGLARHLKIPAGFKKAIRIINKGTIKKIDTASINGRVFLSIAGVGYDAYVANQFAKAPKRGFFTYFSIVSGEYLKYKPKKYTINIDGKEITRRALLITFANSSQFGNNASIDPNAKLDDGFIDVCIVRRIPFLLVPFYVPMLFTKTFHKTHYIEIIRAKEATVTRKKGKSVHFDGDAVKMGNHLEMKINPLSLNIIVP
jgi:YegS/Rv2252/BmrU family lipid kinase